MAYNFQALRAGLPDAMVAGKQWMLCNRAKQPIDPETGYPASKADPANWLSLGDCEWYIEDHPHLRNCMIGYVPTEADPFTIIDLDYKADREYTAEGHAAKAWLYEQLKDVTYLETSVSGRGAHAIVHGKLSADFNKQDFGIEAYGHKGFVVMTGQRMPGSPREIGEVPHVMQVLESQFAYPAAQAKREQLALDINRPASAEELAMDQAFLDWCKSWKNAAEIENWFYAKEVGDDGAGGSDGDARLIQLFYKFCKDRQGDRVQHTLRMFMRSPRAKLLGRKQDPKQYLERTIAKAKAWIDNEEQQKAASMLDVSRMAEAYFAAEMERQAAATSHMVQAPAAEAAPSANLPAMHEGQSTAPQIPDLNKIGALNAPGAAPQQAAQLFTILRPDDVKGRSAPKWMIRGVLPDKGIAAIYGASGSGKSFVALDMSAAVANGNAWFNRKAHKKDVLYLSLEGGGLQNRIKAWEKENEDYFPENVGFIEDQIDLRAPEFLNQLCLAVNPVGGKFNGLIIVDTLNQSAAGMDENSSRDMGEVIKALRYIEKMTDSLVIFVHHATKSEENRSMRGHGSLFAACDAVIEVSRTGDGDTRSWSLVKSKDSADGQTGDFKLAEHVVDHEEPEANALGVMPPPGTMGVEVKSVAVYQYGREVTDEMGEVVVMPTAPVPVQTEGSKGGRGRGKQQNKHAGAMGAPPPSSGESKGRGRPKGGGKQQNFVMDVLAKMVGNHGQVGQYPNQKLPAVKATDFAAEMQKACPPGVQFRLDLKGGLTKVFHDLVIAGNIGLHKENGIDFIWIERHEE